jgi:hypothetical protein
MNEYDEVLAGYRAEIAALEARARELREAWSAAPDSETRQLEAEQIEAQARILRLSLPDILRARFGGQDDDEETEPESEPDEENNNY